MKKIYLAVFLACSMGGAVRAQISQGGFPLTMSPANAEIKAQSVARVTFERPDYAQYLKEDEIDAKVGNAKPYRVAPTLSSDIDMMSSGTWSYLANGSRIWRLEIKVPDAKAMGFNYDKFYLPEGVRFYVKNQNGKQLLGAYTHINNIKEEVFAHQEVQGESIVLEMDIDPAVDLSAIKFHINKVYPYYRGAGVVTELYADSELPNGTQLKPTDAQSPCHVNANCPEGDAPAFAKAKTATVQITMGGGVCSGSLINSAGNSPGTCKPYLLTASHCDGSNSRNDADFVNWVFAFNYQYTTCTGSTLDNWTTRTGARFRARSNYPSMPTPNNALVADFLLLELLAPPQAAANVYYSGWNRDANLFENPDYYTKFIGFHHPGGDRKKLSVSTEADPTGNFNQTSVTNTHWSVVAIVGGTEGGSSGSGLFDVDGLLIGDLSGGPSAGGPCDPMGYTGLYSKLSYAWDNAYDQTNFPAFAGAKSRLKDWLDPNGVGMLKLQATKSDCSDMVVSVNEVEQLNNSIVFYPNPSTGVVNTKVNFADPTSFTVTVFDILGKKQTAYDVNNATHGTYQMNLSNLPNGVYMLNVKSGEAVISRKVVIAK